MKFLSMLVLSAHRYSPLLTQNCQLVPLPLLLSTATNSHCQLPTCSIRSTCSTCFARSRRTHRSAERAFGWMGLLNRKDPPGRVFLYSRFGCCIMGLPFGFCTWLWGTYSARALRGAAAAFVRHIVLVLLLVVVLFLLALLRDAVVAKAVRQGEDGGTG